MESGLVFNIQKYSIQDGPGIRTTVFLKGCPLQCWWCHNPESQAAEPEVVIVESRCRRCGECRKVCPNCKSPLDLPLDLPPRKKGRPKRGGRVARTELPDQVRTIFRGSAAVGMQPEDAARRCVRCGHCVAACPTGARQMVGREMSVDEVLAEILKDRLFYESSGGGATFSGGEPLAQAAFVKRLLEACRAAGIHTAVDTCGYAPKEDLLGLAPLTDLFLYDLKLMDDKRHLRYTGVSNASILANLRALGEVHNAIWLRVPVIPGINDTPEELNAIASCAAAMASVRQVNLLPYHEGGVYKSPRVGRPYKLPKTKTPAPEEMDRAVALFRKHGLNVKKGG